MKTLRSSGLAIAISKRGQYGREYNFKGRLGMKASSVKDIEPRQSQYGREEGGDKREEVHDGVVDLREFFINIINHCCHRQLLHTTLA
jgi:hypothetical protein